MKPILFNTEMVRALLKGRKTVTRQVVKPQPKMQLAYISMGHHHGKWAYPPSNCMEQSGWDEKYRRIDGLTAEDNAMYWTPPCHTGDILYVRETWEKVGDRYFYRADDDCQWIEKPTGGYSEGWNFLKWHPSIHMPKETARLFLRVTDVRVERLRDITEEQARAEGIQPVMVSVDPEDTPDNERTWSEWLPALPGYIECWNRTIKESDLLCYSWEANPWVWVIEFERISKEAALKAEKGGSISNVRCL